MYPPGPEPARLPAAHPGATAATAPVPPAAAAPPWTPRRWGAGLAVILGLAALARLLYLREVAALPFFDQPVGDSAAHLKRAAEIAAGGWLPARPFYYCSIFYPYFLATALAIFHGSLVAVCAIQALAGVAVVGLLAHLARRLYGPLAGLGAGALAALYGPFAFLESDVLGVVWGQLALATAMIACVAGSEEAPRGRPRSTAWMALAGLAFGLAAVERPNLLALAPLAAAWCAARAGPRAWRPLAALAGGVALPLATVLALNVAGSGQWVPLTTSFGINLSLGYHEGANGTFSEPWEREDPEFSAQHVEPEDAMVARASLETGRALDARAASAYWTRRALDWIRAHPGEAAGITLRKAALMLNAAEVPNHLDFGFIREHAPALWLMPVGFGAVLALAVLGFGDAVLRRRRRGETGLLLLLAAGVLASVLPFTVADRYRAPMVLPLIVAAGAGVAALARLARERHAGAERGTAVVLAASLVAALVSTVPLVRPLRGRDEWMLAQAWQARGDLPRAIAAYEAAVRETGDRGELLNNLAMAYRAAGDRARAEAALRRAIAAAPALAYPHKNLGMLLIVRGARDSALAELREAERLAPGDAETAGAIGALLAERGDRDAARAAFARARALAPGDARLRGLIEHYSAALK
ncbi:MAG TPA: hypothetical protein VI792_09680 [Candidatus Eisenbacteria bacterium]